MTDLNWILSLRSEGLTGFFQLFPILGQEAFYLVFISIGYWCWKKAFFRDLAILVCITTLTNAGLKALFHIPRPEGDFLTPITDLYGFPSGDVQVVTTIWLALAWYFKNIAFWIFSLILIGLVTFSRLYLGVHSFADVMGGLFFGLIVFLLYYYSKKTQFFDKIKLNLRNFILLFVLVDAYILLMMYDLKNMIFAAIGMLIGILVGMKLEGNSTLAEAHELQYQNVYQKIGVAILGLAILWGLRTLLSQLWHTEPHYLYIFISYFLMGIYIIYGVPAVVKIYLNRMQLPRN